MRAILMSLAVLAGLLSTGNASFAFHGHHHGGWGYRGWGHHHHGWGVRYGGYRPYYGWNHGWYGGGVYRPYYAGYRGYYGYRGFYPSYSYYYRPPVYRTYYYGGGYPYFFNYPTYYYGYPCFGANDFVGAPTYVFGATSLPPSYPTSELPYGFDGVRPFLDALQANNRPAATTPASALLNRAGSRPQNSLLNRFGGEQVAIAEPPVAKPAVEFSPNVSPPLARQRAREMMAIGDRYFREQKYYDASRKYREAAQTAPDLAETHFRAGHALTAMNRYDQAAESFRKAISLKADPARDGFKLDDLYGDAQIAKTSHIEALAAAALEDTGRADHLLLMGMLLQYDGRQDLAEKCFRRSSALDRNLKGLTAYVTDNEI